MHSPSFPPSSSQKMLSFQLPSKSPRGVYAPRALFSLWGREELGAQAFPSLLHTPPPSSDPLQVPFRLAISSSALGSSSLVSPFPR